MSLPKILLQLDTDAQPSVFDSVVAIDAGAEQLLRHGSITSEGVRNLVHGLMFTRGVKDLQHSAVFVGGSDVARGAELLKAVKESYFGPFRCSVMLDANGCNTTAAAAVLAAAREMKLEGACALVLAGTGPVGQRVVRLLAREKAEVRVASRKLDKAQAVCETIAASCAGAQLTPWATASEEETWKAVAGAQVIIAAGAAEVELLNLTKLREQSADTLAALRVAIDLNAVPPLGIAGVDAQDKAVQREGVVCYGALGVGGTKMKIHRAAVRALFAANNQVLDAEEIFDIGQQLEKV